ncbi:MAG: hypothetical protein WC059_02250 [Candidatus Paceibacterota bacterium]
MPKINFKNSPHDVIYECDQLLKIDPWNHEAIDNKYYALISLGGNEKIINYLKAKSSLLYKEFNEEKYGDDDRFQEKISHQNRIDSGEDEECYLEEDNLNESYYCDGYEEQEKYEAREIIELCDKKLVDILATKSQALYSLDELRKAFYIQDKILEINPEYYLDFQ